MPPLAGIEPETHRVFALTEDNDARRPPGMLESVLDIDVDVVGDEGGESDFTGEMNPAARTKFLNSPW